MSVRVRFAPSPTGFLHVGGARTAIFNWLYARRHGGTFVLRIEDTDRQRSSDEMVQTILDGMRWLGLDADEGPFLQSAAFERHVRDAKALLARGQAYRCFCSAEALEAARRERREFIYPRTCRSVPAEEAERRAQAGEACAVRFRVPEGTVAWDDAVHGPTAFPHDTIEDFVLLRSDGSPTYQMSVVSDDTEMAITHVIRGDDHLSNTPKQILLYRGLGHTPPTFAHLPMILGDDKKRLSKRHGAVSVLEYKEQGYLPQAMLNFLALLGWAPGDDREKLSLEELIAAFDLDGVGKSGAIFDLKKLDWLNGQYLNDLDGDQLAEILKPRLVEAGLWRAEFDEKPRPRALLGALELLKARARTLDDIVAHGRPYLDPSDAIPYEEAAAAKSLVGEDLPEHMGELARAFADVEPWSAAGLESALRAVATTRGTSAGRLIHPTRIAVTGEGVGPSLFAVLEVLGRERTLARLSRLVDALPGRAIGGPT
jgi:glutamyl-tRNA synthetase